MAKCIYLCKIKNTGDLVNDYGATISNGTIYYKNISICTSTLDSICDQLSFFKQYPPDKENPVRCFPVGKSQYSETRNTFSAYSFELKDIKPIVILPYDKYMETYEGDFNRIAKEVFRLKPGTVSAYNEDTVFIVK